MIQFLLIVLTLSILMVVYPFYIYPSILKLICYFQRRDSGLEATEPINTTNSVSILLCAHNEEKTISKKIINLLEIKEFSNSKIDVLIYCDGCEDETLEICKKYEDKIRIFYDSTQKGKSFGMNFLVSQTDSDILVFTDANTRLYRNCINEILRVYHEEKNIGGVCGSIKYLNEVKLNSSETSYWSKEENLKILETKFDTAISADGALFSVRRKYYSAVPLTVMDDFYTSIHVLFSGSRLFQSKKCMGEESISKSNLKELQRKFRISVRAMTCHLILRSKIQKMSPRRKFMYISHKLLRWYSGTGILLMILSMFILVFMMGSPFFHIIWFGPLSTLILCQMDPRFKLLVNNMTMLVVTSLGAIYALFGKRVQKWNPEKDSR